MIRKIAWALGLPVRALLVGVVLAYRYTLGPMVAGRCRFHPSCSAYALEALRVHGAVKGSVMAGWRVLRCNPLWAGGPDPVPPRARGGSIQSAKQYESVIHGRPRP